MICHESALRRIDDTYSAASKFIYLVSSAVATVPVRQSWLDIAARNRFSALYGLRLSESSNG